ncbi:MAG: hypothetical protein ACREF0_01580 [Acetobacteraceae bacterium]
MIVANEKIDETVLALFRLTLRDGARARKGHEREALDRLHRKGLTESSRQGKVRYAGVSTGNRGKT